LLIIQKKTFGKEIYEFNSFILKYMSLHYKNAKFLKQFNREEESKREEERRESLLLQTRGSYPSPNSESSIAYCVICALLKNKFFKTSAKKKVHYNNQEN
jgi:hypothetical protein